MRFAPIIVLSAVMLAVLACGSQEYKVSPKAPADSVKSAPDSSKHKAPANSAKHKEPKGKKEKH